MVASPVILHDFNNFNRFQLFCNRSLSTNCGAQAHMLRIELYEERARNAIAPRSKVYPGYQGWKQQCDKALIGAENVRVDTVNR